MAIAQKIKLTDYLPADCANGRTLWIDGEWQASADGQTFPTVDPATGLKIASISQGKAADVDRAVQAAKKASKVWADMDGMQRAAIMRKAAELIREHRNALGTLDSIDSGKTISETAGRNVEGTAAMFDFYAGVTDKIRGSVIDMGPQKTGLVEKEPYGVVGAISPWNFPMSNAATKIAPILACGNALVLKPAEQTPLSALLLAHILDLAGVPKGVFSVVTGVGAEAGAALVEHPDVPKISFTGSTVTGRRIAAAAGQRLKSVTLELGGKSPFIVFDDADLDAAASGAVTTVFMNQGQTCTSCAKILVARPLMAAFIEKCKEKVAGIKIGDPLDPKNDLGPIVSTVQLDRVRRLLAEGLACGSTQIELKADYNPLEGGNFIAPMIVTDLDPNSSLAKEEIFGPVMTIYPFDTDAEAYTAANDTEYGLAASVWTTSLSRAEIARRTIDTGIVWINCVHTLSFGTPVPGRKASGLGSEYGLEVVDNYMQLKTTVTMFGGYRGLF
ncbi:aldehyde dehydrogenase family protein [Rhizobium rhizogenes]|uniref:aldehyde dehydrogenase family protein n=1 Tax=Rhizobium rhizogenes TaxID=359 RepID=UPI001574C6B6|nr:aldehyde dehydrogenase family protein [Rhizobium rhizogenes]NTH22823.1 aldehyde dehydrogenase [Rhizobium rhizogenes]NTH35853.1 aldehyde dehydrogenase [Rhizobium rhizogenes]